MGILEYFFSIHPDQLVSTLINTLISVVGVLSLRELFLAWREISDEEKAIRDVREAVVGAEPESERGSVQARLGLLIQRWAPNSILHERFDLLEAIEQAGDSPDSGSLGAQVVSLLERRVALARWAANGVVLLGLGGTLVGLSLAVISGQALLNEDLLAQADAVKSLAQTFAGLQTAFSTTLWGIIFSMLIGCSVTVLRRRQTRFVEHLELFSLQFLYPNFRSSPGEALARAARHLSEIEQQLHRSLQEVVAGISQTTAQVKEQGISLTATVDRSISTLVEESRESAGRLALKWDGVLAHQGKLLGDPASDSVTLPALAARLDVAGASMIQLTDGVGRLLPSVEETIARQVDRQARDLHETMHDYTQRLLQTVERQEVGVVKHLAQLDALLPGLEERMAAALRRHEEALTQNIGPATRELSQTLASGSTVSARLREATDALAALITHVDVTLQRAAESPSMRDRGDTDRIVAAIEQLRATVASQEAPGAAKPQAPTYNSAGSAAAPPSVSGPVVTPDSAGAAPAAPAADDSHAGKAPESGGLVSSLYKKLFG